MPPCQMKGHSAMIIFSKLTKKKRGKKEKEPFAFISSRKEKWQRSHSSILMSLELLRTAL